MRVTSEFWVSALCRRAAAEGAFAYVVQRGAKEAGAIFVITNNMQGAVSLHAPAPQSFFEEDIPTGRMFEQVVELNIEQDVRDRLERERKFDPDIWIVEIEDREGRDFIES